MEKTTLEPQEETQKVTPEQILYRKEHVILPAIVKKFKEICPALENEELDNFVIIKENHNEEKNSITFSITLTKEGRESIEQIGILSGIRSEIKAQAERAMEPIIHGEKEYPSGEEGKIEARADIKAEGDKLTHPDTIEREKFTIRASIRELNLLLKRDRFHQKEKALKKIEELTKLIQNVKVGDKSGLNKPQIKTRKDLLQEIESTLKRTERLVSMPIEIKERPLSVQRPQKGTHVKNESHQVRRAILTLLAIGFPLTGGIAWNKSRASNNQASPLNQPDPPELVLTSPREIATAFVERNRATNLADVKSLAQKFYQQYPELSTEGNPDIENIIFLKNFQVVIENEATNYDWEKAIKNDPLYIVEGVNKNNLATCIGDFLLDIPYLKENPRLLNESGQRIAPQLFQKIANKYNIPGRRLQGIKFEGSSISFIW